MTWRVDPRARIGSFVVALVLAVGAGAAVGAAVGPVGEEPAPALVTHPPHLGEGGHD